MFNKNNTSVSRWVGGKGTGAPFWGFRSWPSSLNGKVLDICIKTDPICDGTVGSFIGWAAGAKTAHGDYGTRKYTGSSYVITKWAGIWLGT